jgi:hypothetical protein
MSVPVLSSSHALEDVDVHLCSWVLCIEAVDHLDAGSSVPGRGEQAHNVPLDQTEHDHRRENVLAQVRFPRNFGTGRPA